MEGLDFGETYALGARMEAIRILLTCVCAYDVRLYQMDVKSTFLRRYINKLGYVEQQHGFQYTKKSNHVKLEISLYGLKQEPRAWYKILRNLSLSNGFKMRKVDTTLLTTKILSDLFTCQVYVYDIILD